MAWAKHSKTLSLVRTPDHPLIVGGPVMIMRLDIDHPRTYALAHKTAAVKRWC